MVLTPKQNLLRVIRHDRPQWVPNGMESVILVHPPVVERPAQAGCDAFGVHWSYEEGAEGGTFPTHGGHTVSDLGRWREQITIPDVDALDWDAVAERVAEIDREECLVSGFVEMGLFERSYLLLGMDQALMAYVTEPERMAELVGAIADYKIALIERFDDVADLDMVWYGDDWGTQDRLFMRPDVWRAILKPHTARIYDCMKRRGILDQPALLRQDRGQFSGIWSRWGRTSGIPASPATTWRPSRDSTAGGSPFAAASTASLCSTVRGRRPMRSAPRCAGASTRWLLGAATWPLPATACPMIRR